MIAWKGQIRFRTFHRLPRLSSTHRGPISGRRGSSGVYVLMAQLHTLWAMYILWAIFPELEQRNPPVPCFFPVYVQHPPFTAWGSLLAYHRPSHGLWGSEIFIDFQVVMTLPTNAAQSWQLVDCAVCSLVGGGVFLMLPCLMLLSRGSM